ncbi:MAG: cupin domain-containing protein [Sneathiellales bacterium]|nr:cupin domain-containing protein [Sneathiellales bacterium]
MTIKKLQDIDIIDGGEGTEIRQIFHPHNTLNGIRYSLSHSELKPGKKSKLHKIKSSEVYYILQGEGSLQIDDEVFKVSKDQAIYIAPHSKQSIENTGKDNLRFLCIVDPAWKHEDETVLE